MRDRFGVTNPKAQALKFHAQTGGSTLTAQQPENNIVRVAIQALSAVCGGAQSLHTNSFDEALALPTERAARIALRTQQLLAHEGGGTDTADPLGGAYFIETLTDELEERARELITRVDDLGGAVAAVEQGFVQREIEDAAYSYAQQVIAEESGAADTADPLGGAYFVEALTDELQARAEALMAEVAERGGAVAAIEQGFVQGAIADQAYRHEEALASGERAIVGVNKYVEREVVPTPVFRIDEEAVALQIGRLREFRARRDQAAVDAALARVRGAAEGSDNLLYPMKDALRTGATVGEVCGTLRGVFGEYDSAAAG